MRLYTSSTLNSLAFLVGSLFLVSPFTSTPALGVKTKVGQEEESGSAAALSRNAEDLEVSDAFSNSDKIESSSKRKRGSQPEENGEGGSQSEKDGEIDTKKSKTKEGQDVSSTKGGANASQSMEEDRSDELFSQPLRSKEEGVHPNTKARTPLEESLEAACWPGDGMSSEKSFAQRWEGTQGSVCNASQGESRIEKVRASYEEFCSGGQYQEAINLVTNTFESESNLWLSERLALLHLRGLAMYKSGLNDGTIKDCTRAIEAGDKEEYFVESQGLKAFILFLRGHAHAKKGLHEKAFQDFEASLGLREPGHDQAVIHVSMGTLDSALNNIPSAIQHFTTAIDMLGEEDKKVRLSALTSRKRAYERGMEKDEMDIEVLQAFLENKG